MACFPTEFSSSSSKSSVRLKQVCTSSVLKDAEMSRLLRSRGNNFLVVFVPETTAAVVKYLGVEWVGLSGGGDADIVDRLLEQVE